MKCWTSSGYSWTWMATEEGWARDEGKQYWVKFDNGDCYGVAKDEEKVVLV